MMRGRHIRWGAKLMTSDLLSIKISDFSRHDAFALGWHVCEWLSGKYSLGSISFFVDGATLTLCYQTKTGYAGNLRVVHRVLLSYTPCTFGGSRPWFLCVCGRRVANLYIEVQKVACRHCLALVYPSQRMREIDRLLVRIDKLEVKLGDIHVRPKGMHRRTFDGLREKIVDAYTKQEELFNRISMGRSLGE